MPSTRAIIRDRVGICVLNARQHNEIFAISIHVQFSASLKTPFKFSPHSRNRSAGGLSLIARSPQLDGRVRRWEADMARFEINDVDAAALGEAPAGADTFFELGMMYSSGRSVPIDYVTRAQVVQSRGHARQRGCDAAAPRNRRPDVGERDRRRPTRRARLAQGPLIRLQMRHALSDTTTRMSNVERCAPKARIWPEARFEGRESQSRAHRVRAGNIRWEAALRTAHPRDLTGNSRFYRCLPIGDVAEWLKAAVC